MTKSLEELDAEAAGVLEAFAAIEAAASKLETHLSDATSRIARNRAALETALEDLRHDVAALAEQTEDFEARASSTLDEFDAAMQGVADSLANVAAESAEAAAEVRSEFEQGATTLLAASARVGEARETYGSAAMRRETDLTARSNETQTLGTAAAARVEEVQEGIQALHAATAAMAEELETHVDERRRELETWHEGLLANAAQCVAEMAALIAEAGANQVRAPLVNYVNGLNAELQANAMALLRRVLAGVEDGLHKIEEEIVEAAGGTQQKRASMAPIREALDAVKEPIEEVLETVRSTASIVGFSA